MKKIIFKTFLPLVAVVLAGVVIVCSCREEPELWTAKGYFVQLKEPGNRTEINARITAYILQKSESDPHHLKEVYIIVGYINDRILPENYVKGDTIFAEAVLKMVYPIEDEICFGVGPYFKLVKIKQITE